MTYINTDEVGNPASIDENGNVIRRAKSLTNTYGIRPNRNIDQEAYMTNPAGAVRNQMMFQTEEQTMAEHDSSRPHTSYPASRPPAYGGSFKFNPNNVPLNNEGLQ